jgi:GMP synthase-like glutamine amidotransferase
MTRVLIIQHVETEGPGTLGDFFRDVQAETQTVRVFEGDPLPNDIGGFDALVSMGGPMNVYEEGRYPFLREETEFLRRVIDANIPTLGICLGAQLIAKACYAPVTKAARGEIGWRNVSLTNAGSKDILFEGIPATMRVFQWHDDTFDVPYGGNLLVTAGTCPNQAFRYRNAYGIQFHIEVTRGMLQDWLGTMPACGECVRTFDNIGDTLRTQANRIYANFLWLVDLHQRSLAAVEKPREQVNVHYSDKRETGV